MSKVFGESNQEPRTDERPDVVLGRHSLAAALGELITDPGISPGLLYTAKALKGRVEGGDPTDQAQQDATFLLQWFRKHRQQEAAPMVVVLPEPKSVFDTAAMAAIHQRSIEAANQYNLMHAAPDTTVLMYWAPVAPQD